MKQIIFIYKSKNTKVKRNVCQIITKPNFKYTIQITGRQQKG